MARVFLIFKTRHAPRWWEVLFLLLVVLFAAWAAGRNRESAYASEVFGTALPEGTVGYWLREGMISPTEVQSPLEYLSEEKIAGIQKKMAFYQSAALLPQEPVVVSAKPVLPVGDVEDELWMAPLGEDISLTPAFPGTVTSALPLAPEVGELPKKKNLPKAELAATAVSEMPVVSEEKPALHPLLATPPAERPLGVLEAWLEFAQKDIPTRVKEYSCLIVKTERVGGKLREEESIYAKIRHEPYSVYLRFAKPKKSEGREAIYVAGRNDGKLIAHGSGFERMFGNFWLQPTSPQAMDGNLHPITENGVVHILQQMRDICHKQGGNPAIKAAVTECKLNGRACLRLEIVTPGNSHHRAHFYIDREYDLPVRYAYWNAANELQEERTYLELKLNPGFSETDFDHNNGGYNF